MRSGRRRARGASLRSGRRSTSSSEASSRGRRSRPTTRASRALVADWLTERAHYSPEHVFNDTEWRLGAVGAWLVGFGLYQWLSPVGPAWWTRLVAHTHPQSVSFTASLPSFAAAFVLTLILKSAFGVGRRRRTALA